MPHTLFDRDRNNIQAFINSNVIADWTATRYNDNGSTTEVGGEGAFYHQVPSVSHIADMVHSKSKKTRRYPMAQVFHRHIDMPILPRFNSFVASNGALHLMHGEPRYPFNWGIYGLLNSDEANVFGVSMLVPQPIVNVLSEEAFIYFSTSFPQELSFGEFTQGLFQLKQLLPKLEDSITKTLSGAYLTKEFGWDNLLPDLDTLGNLFNSVTDRMEYLKKTYGIPTRMGFSRTRCHELPNPLESYDIRSAMSFTFGGCRVGLRLLSYQADFRATAWITQTLEMVDGVIGFVRVLTGQLGLNNPVKLFWELVPFSFLVDWFFNVSRALDRWLRIEPPVGWNVFDVTHSTLVRLTVALDFYEMVAGVETRRQTIEVPVRIYDRYVGLSLDLELLDPNLLSTNQLVILAALLLGGS